MTTKQTQFNGSITGVNPIRTHGFGVYKGRRVVWGVRVDERLLKQAKPVLRAKFGSDCRGVEAWLAGLVATTKGNQLLGVNPSNTVEIGKLVIERNLRSRRKLTEKTVETEQEVSETVEVTSCGFCFKPAVAIYQHESGREQYACDYHKGLLEPRDDWSFLKTVVQEGV